MAERLAQAAEKTGAEDVTWADVVLFGSPTRFGNVASQLKQFIEVARKLKTGAGA